MHVNTSYDVIINVPGAITEDLLNDETQEDKGEKGESRRDKGK